MSSHACLEGIKRLVFLFLFSLLFLFLFLFKLDFINDVNGSAVVSLKVSASKLEHTTLLLIWLEEGIRDKCNDLLPGHLLKVIGDFLTQGHALSALTHQILDFLQVVSSSIVLVFLDHLDRGAAVSGSDVLDEVGAVTNRLSFKSVDEWAEALVKSIWSAYLQQTKTSLSNG